MQTAFVDNPSGAVGDADRLVTEVMRERGYPVDDFDQRAADISVDHPTVVENYRAAHGIYLSQQNGDTGTAAAAAFVHYRVLFEKLLTADNDRGHDNNDRPQETGTARRQAHDYPTTAIRGQFHVEEVTPAASTTEHQAGPSEASTTRDRPSTVPSEATIQTPNCPFRRPTRGGTPRWTVRCRVDPNCRGAPVECRDCVICS